MSEEKEQLPVIHLVDDGMDAVLEMSVDVFFGISSQMSGNVAVREGEFMVALAGGLEASLARGSMDPATVWSRVGERLDGLDEFGDLKFALRVAMAVACSTAGTLDGWRRVEVERLERLEQEEKAADRQAKKQPSDEEVIQEAQAILGASYRPPTRPGDIKRLQKEIAAAKAKAKRQRRAAVKAQKQTAK